MLRVERESPVGGLVCLAATLVFKHPMLQGWLFQLSLLYICLSLEWCCRVPGEIEPALNVMWARDWLLGWAPLIFAYGWFCGILYTTPPKAKPSRMQCSRVPFCTYFGGEELHQRCANPSPPLNMLRFKEIHLSRYLVPGSSSVRRKRRMPPCLSPSTAPKITHSASP